MATSRRILAAVVVLALAGTACSSTGDTAAAPEVPAASTKSRAAAPQAKDKARPAAAEATQKPGRNKDGGGDSPKPKPEPEPEPKPEPEPEPDPKPKQEFRTYLVTRVIDGDTVELGSGAGVRVVGIDTPEEGNCGYDQATANMVRLVEGKRVRLVRSDENTDHYGRLLRYVDSGSVDAGLRQIQFGWAIARYDSRDGYGFHARESRYIAADKATRNKGWCAGNQPEPAPQPAPAPTGKCAAGYQPCIPPSPPDVDCGDVVGPIMVSGSDPHGLDADGDGVACES